MSEEKQTSTSSGLPELEEYQFESRDGNGRRYVAVFLAMSLLMVSTVVATNVVVDPRSQFPSDVYQPLIPDRPQEKLDLYNAQPAPPEAIILGTSRTAALRPSDLESHGIGPAFNYALAGSSFPDAVLVYDFLSKRGDAPDYIFHGVEPSLFHPNPPSAIQRSPARGEYTGDYPTLSEYTAAALRSLARPYVFDTLTSLYLAHIAGYPDLQLVLADDGHTIPTQQRSEDAAAEARRLALIRHQIEVELLPFASEFEGLDHSAVGLLHDYIDSMVAQGTQVYLFLPPIHPLATQILDDNLDWRFINEELLEVLMPHCAQGIHVFDFTDPAAFGGDPSEFQDAIHFGYNTGAALIAAMIEGSEDRCREA